MKKALGSTMCSINVTPVEGDGGEIVYEITAGLTADAKTRSGMTISAEAALQLCFEIFKIRTGNTGIPQPPNPLAKA